MDLEKINKLLQNLLNELNSNNKDSSRDNDNNNNERVYLKDHTDIINAYNDYDFYMFYNSKLAKSAKAYDKLVFYYSFYRKHYDHKIDTKNEYYKVVVKENCNTKEKTVGIILSNATANGFVFINKEVAKAFAKNFRELMLDYCI